MVHSNESVSNVTCIYGKPVSVNCTIPDAWTSVKIKVKDEIGYKFALFNGSTCTVPAYARHNFATSCQGNTLTIQILQPKNTTVWQCAFSSSVRELYVNSTKVIVRAEMPVVSLRQDIYVITEGSHLTIPCEFTGAPISNVTWERRNDIIRWSHRQSESLNLTLRNVSRDMAGNYTCSVAVDYERTYTDSKTLTLVVKYPPSLRPDSTLVVSEGQPIVFIPCGIVENGFPDNYTVMRWQHFVSNNLIRNLTTENYSIHPVNSTFTLVLKSVSFNDTGSYKCEIGNGVPDLKGSMEQTTRIDLIVKSPPHILQRDVGYHGEIGKVFSVLFQCVGFPNMSLKINVKEKGNSPSFNVSIVHEYVEISMHDTVLNVNGTSIEMDFGVIKDWFNTTYELIAENSVGTKKHTFFVDSHDFPRKPYHVHFKAFEKTAMLEWEAVIPDLDKHFDIIVKNLSGTDNLYTIQGTNSQRYEYHLTNLEPQSNIIQICNTNEIGRNCTTTFKIKTFQEVKLDEKQMLTSGPNLMVILLSTGLIALVFVGFVVIYLRCYNGYNRGKGRKIRLGRLDTVTRDLLEGPTGLGDIYNSGREEHAYITPEWGVSVDRAESPSCLCTASCQSNVEVNEYASVEDSAIARVVQARGQGGECGESSGGYCEIRHQKTVKYVKK
ncbi:neural cell adhesion molecule 2-like isoform X2 [Crassostrea virginica]